MGYVKKPPGKTFVPGRRWFLTSQLRKLSRTTPTLWVFVIRIGPSAKPDSSSHGVPVISPFPFWENQPPKTGSDDCLPRGQTAVTPVRTGPAPTCSLPSPEMSVVCPTSTPATSTMEFSGPGAPSNGTPRSRALGLVCAANENTQHPASSTVWQILIDREL